MPRYFIEVAYKGTNYSGFQVQKNANSVQSEIEKALSIFFRKDFGLTGSSRTDAGVHALQNYFHFDTDQELNSGIDFLYNLNSLLPLDIVIKKIFRVKDTAHCRFDAISREYRYTVYNNKDPFLQGMGYYYPYKLDLGKLNEAAALIMQFKDFTSFSKRNTQVKSFICDIKHSEWIQEETLQYTVIADRFLRGMVKGLVGTMLRAGTGKISIDDLKKIIEGRDPSKVDFSPPSHGLLLAEVVYKMAEVCL